MLNAPERRQSTWKDKQESVGMARAQKTMSFQQLGDWTQWSSSRRWSAAIVTSTKFDAFIAGVVVLNSVTMALESEMPNSREFFIVTDAIFLVIYTVELALRLHVAGIKLFRVHANILDVVIVIAGWASLIFDILGNDAEGLRMVTTLKVLRAFRSIRLLRMFTYFEGCWIIAASFFSCLKPLFWTCTFMAIVLFTFTMFAIELIGRSDAFNDVPEKEDFHSTHIAFFTLFQLSTLDEWRFVVQPLCDRQGWAYIFFAIYLSITAMSLMNLVTAVVVDSSMKRTLNEEEYLRSKERRQRAIEGESIKDFISGLESSEEQDKDEGAQKPSVIAQGDLTGPRATMVQEGGKTLGGHQILGASSKWRGIEKIFDAFCIKDPADVEKIMISCDDNGDGVLSVPELLDALLDLRQITEDKHRLALIQACDTSESRCEIVERCLRDVRAPEDCVRTLRRLEEQLAKSAILPRLSVDSTAQAAVESPLSQAINEEINMMQSELQEQRSKIKKQKKELAQLKDAVFELHTNMAFAPIFPQDSDPEQPSTTLREAAGESKIAASVAAVLAP